MTVGQVEWIPAGLPRRTTAYFWFSHKLRWLCIFQTSEWYIRTSDFYDPLAWWTNAFNLKLRSLNTFLNNQGPDSIKRWHLISIGNPIVEIRWSDDRLISTMGFPILVRWHLESGPRSIELLSPVTQTNLIHVHVLTHVGLMDADVFTPNQQPQLMMFSCLRLVSWLVW